MFHVKLPEYFSFEASRRFLSDTPFGSPVQPGPSLDMALRTDGSWHPVGVRLHQSGVSLAVDVTHNPDAISKAEIVANLRWVFSLGLDPADLVRVAGRDPVVAKVVAAVDWLFQWSF